MPAPDGIGRVDHVHRMGLADPVASRGAVPPDDPAQTNNVAQNSVSAAGYTRTSVSGVHRAGAVGDPSGVAARAGHRMAVVDLKAVRAVLLDMDGTLVDSDAAVERSWAQWAREYEVDLRAVLAIAHGSPADRTVRRLRPDLDEPALSAAAARQLALEYDDLSDIVPAAGARELLQVLDRFGLPWAVVTSADRRLAKARLDAAGIAPPLLVTVEDVSAGKPDPEGYLQAARQLGVDPARCLVVEDAEPGLAAGRAAGAQVAALRGRAGDLSIDNLMQLAHLLARARATP